MSKPKNTSLQASMRRHRPFYKKKRYVIPALLLVLAMCAPNNDREADRVAAAPPAARVQQSDTFDREAWLAANDRTTAENAAAVAKKAAAEKAAAEKAAAEAAAKARAAAEAKAKEAARVARAEAARVEAQRVAAARAAAAEAERVAAEQAAAAAAAEEAVSSVYYENCDAVRAAGAAPIRVGDPGYADHLDRDGDGQGCGAD